MAARTENDEKTTFACAASTFDAFKRWSLFQQSECVNFSIYYHFLHEKDDVVPMINYIVFFASHVVECGDGFDHNHR